MSERELVAFKTRIAKDYPAYWELADYVLILEQERNNYKELYEKEIEKSKKFKEYLNGCIKELDNQSMNSLKNVLNGGIIEITKTILERYEDLERK
ncbi:MAG: hypothetical protein IJO32_00500 [Bacilli bacterium]|nr:hypothetical protein [Bacilli bacterium]